MLDASEDEMVNISSQNIKIIRAHGFRLKGDNWMRARTSQMRPSEEIQTVKIVNGDTLAIVYLPAGLLKDNLN